MFLVRTPQQMPWHLLALWPVLMIAMLSTDEQAREDLAAVCFLWILAIGLQVFGYPPWPDWIGAVGMRLVA